MDRFSSTKIFAASYTAPDKPPFTNPSSATVSTKKKTPKNTKMGAPASLADINSVLSKLVVTYDNHSLDKDINLVLPIVGT